MFKNYLKIASRNLFRHKGFSLTNLLGLTIGITCTILIVLWVQDELNYDKFHANYKNIHQVMVTRISIIQFLLTAIRFYHLQPLLKGRCQKLSVLSLLLIGNQRYLFTGTLI
jgi:magnesium-transporting ATPase (P-type)